MHLGLMSGKGYQEGQASLSEEHGVVFYTDGLVEAHNPHGEMFGTPRPRDLLSEHPTARADFSATLMEELGRFTREGREQEDDITLEMLRRS